MPPGFQAGALPSELPRQRGRYIRVILRGGTILVHEARNKRISPRAFTVNRTRPATLQRLLRPRRKGEAVRLRFELRGHCTTPTRLAGESDKPCSGTLPQRRKKESNPRLITPAQFSRLAACHHALFSRCRYLVMPRLCHSIQGFTRRSAALTRLSGAEESIPLP